MGRMQRDKGARVEREIVNIFRKHGIEARRTAPMQAGYGDTRDGDIEADGWGRGEVKARKSEFKQIYAYLEGNEFLVIKRDKCPPLIVMELKEALGREVSS